MLGFGCFVTNSVLSARWFWSHCRAMRAGIVASVMLNSSKDSKVIHAFRDGSTGSLATMDAMVNPAPGYMNRLAAVNKLLIALLDFLDPGGVRYPIFRPP